MHHATRSVLAVIARFPRGAANLSRRFARWITDAAYAPVVARALESGTRKDADEARASRSQRIRERISGLCFLTAIAGPGGAVVHVLVWPYVWQAALVLLAVVVFAAGGKPREASEAVIIAADEPKPQGPVTADAVVTAFRAAMPPVKRALEADPAALRIIGPVHRDGPGWAAMVELPAGVTASEAIGASAKLASGFGKAPLAVAVDPDPDHAGRVALWVGDKAPAGNVTWRLADAERVDILDRFPIGEDLRGRPFTITLADTNVLLGAMPKYGKTATLRQILLAAALDPRAAIYAFDLKGGTDLLPLESCAVKVVSGEEDEDLEQLLEALTAVREEIRSRNKAIRQMDPRERPDGKITSADATRLGWSPIVFAIDEAQIAYENETYGKDIAKFTIDIFKRGRSVGIHVLLATQRFDAASIPTAVSTNAHLRMCGRVEGFQASNMVLGANAHSAGYSATTLTQPGVMWVKGATDVPAVVRLAKVDAALAWQVAARAAAARADRGFVPLALAPASEPDRSLPAKHDLVGRVRHVWPAGEEKLWTEAILGLLRESFPGDYTDMKPAELSRMLPGSPRQVKKNGVNRQGYALADMADRAPA